MKSGEQIKKSIKAKQTQDKSKSIATRYSQTSLGAHFAPQHIKNAPGKMMNILLSPPLRFLRQERDKNLSQRTRLSLSLWGAAPTIFFPFYFSHLLPHKHVSPKL